MGKVIKKGKQKKPFRKRDRNIESSLLDVEEPTMENPMEVNENSDEEYDTRNAVMKQNRKNKKSGGFQSMGLCYNVYKGVFRKGYKVPTPIQRKCIPLIMDGKDVVAMARTGSGKTAAFLIPMFERLQTHLTTGARALILSPTRELALQTLKFAKEIGKYTGLKAAVILGGDRMEEQFAALHENPDIIIATPGRFMHVLVEMNFKLQSVQYLVFDEADRLFEMGFQEQLHEILNRLPESRQTLLFSATLPKLLVEFARAGLHDPTLVRLDVDTKLSENLRMSFAYCRQEDKTAILLHLLQNVIKPKEQTVVFVATKHHVEYLNMILTQAGISCSHSYSSLDQTARKINVAKFRNGKCRVLLVTDLAARGIDIPLLDNVINYNFPAKPKLFVHRVGRVARAGQSGTAMSLVAPDEVAYVFDLHLFLGRPLSFARSDVDQSESDGLFGRVPQSCVEEYDEELRAWHRLTDIEGMKKVIGNAYTQYLKSRPHAASESIKRAKQTDFSSIGYSPVFVEHTQERSDACSKLLDQMKSYKPSATIFEINSTSRTAAFDVMKHKRSYHDRVIARNTLSHQLKVNAAQQMLGQGQTSQEQSTDLELQEAFTTVIAGKKPRDKKQPVKDDENYVPYRPKDYQSEKGLSISTSFENDVAAASFDITGDDRDQLRKLNNAVKWDRKRKRFVGANSGKDANQKKIKTESGQWIKASYKTNVYKDWLERNKVAEAQSDEEGGASSDDEQAKKRRKARVRTDRLQVLGGGRRRGFHMKGKNDEPPASKNKFKRTSSRPELKRTEQILKQRKQKAKTESFQKHRSIVNKKRKAMKGKKK